MRLRGKESLARVAGCYRNAARALMVLLVLGVVVAPAIHALTPPPLQVSVGNAQITSCNPAEGGEGLIYGSVSYNATVLVSGQYTGQIIFNGTGQLSGSAAFTGGAITDNFTFSAGNAKPSPLNYPGSTSAVLSQNVGGTLFACSKGSSLVLQITVYAYSGDGKTLLGTSGTSTTGSFGSSDIYIKAVALPLFNDTMLGARVGSSDPTIPGLGNIYNFLLVFSIILLGVGFMVSYSAGSLFSKEETSTEGLLLNLFLGVIFVLIFPLIYDEVATIVNYMSQTIIAYPGTDYASRLQVLWNTMTFGSAGSFWSIITGGFYNLIFFVLSAIVYIMLFFLGVIRIFLIGVMIAAFPLSLGLKMIPFTKKLSQTVEDTLYGLILAALMSAIVLGVGSYIIQPAEWGASTQNIFFQAVGSDGASWVAAAALIAAVLIPTVFAPLTGTLFQTASQAVMTGVGTAAIAGAGAAMPLGGAAMAPLAGGIGKAAGGVASGMVSEGAQGAAMGSLSQRLLYAAPAVARNVILATATGTLGGMGGREAAKAIGRIAPMTTTQDIRASIAQKQMNDIQAQNFTEALTPVQNKVDQHMTLQAYNNLPDEAKESFSMAATQRKYDNAVEKPHEVIDSLSPGGSRGATLRSPGNAATAEQMVRAKLESLDRNNEEHMKAFHALQHHANLQEKGTRRETRR